MAYDLPTPGPPAAPARIDRVGDGLVLTISAQRLVPGPWQDAWMRAAEDRVPRVVVVTDLADDDLEDIAVEVQELMGDDSVAVVRYLPLEGDDGDFAGVLDLATLRIHEYPVAGQPEHRYRDADVEHVALTADARADLMTIVATHAVDDDALSAMLDGRAFDIAVEFIRCVTDGSVCPVVPAEALHEVAELLELVRAGRRDPQ